VAIMHRSRLGRIRRLIRSSDGASAAGSWREERRERGRRQRQRTAFLPDVYTQEGASTGKWTFRVILVVARRGGDTSGGEGWGGESARVVARRLFTAHRGPQPFSRPLSRAVAM